MSGDTYRHRCPECDAHLFGKDRCEFCANCEEEGIVNGGYWRDRVYRRRDR